MASTTLTPFHYGDEQVRTYEENGEIWFIATDVARVLGYGDATHMTRGLDSDEVRLHNVETRAGSRSVSTISLAGLFHVLNTARVEAARPIFDRAWGRSYVKGFPEKKEAKKNKEKK